MNSDEPKPLQVPSFAAHSTRGLIRDRAARRRMMLIAIAVALVLIVGGSTVFSRALDPHAHPLWCVLYWLACAWMTTLALLLAIYDALVVRREARRLRETLQREFSAKPLRTDER